VTGVEARLRVSTLTPGSPRIPHWRGAYGAGSAGVRARIDSTCTGDPVQLIFRRRGTDLGIPGRCQEAVDQVHGNRQRVARIGCAQQLDARSDASNWAELVGPRFEPPELRPSYGCGDMAEGRGQKYCGPSNGWPISSEANQPVAAGGISEPLAAREQHRPAIP